MNDSSGVSSFHRLRDLFGDWQRLRHGQRTRHEEFGQRWTVDQFENQCLDGARLFDAVQCRDVGVVEGGEYARLALEPDETIGIACKRVRQDLECHFATESRITSAIDLAHATGTDEGDDLVVAECLTSGKCHE